MATFRDLLNQTKAEIREVDTAEADERARSRRRRARRPRARRVRAGRHPRRAPHPPRPPREPTSRAASPTRTRPSSSTAPAASARPSPPRRSSELGYTDVVSVAGGFNKWKDEGRDWTAPAVAHPRAAQPLPAPPAAARGRRGGPAEAARRQGAAARRRRPRLAGRAVPRRRRRRHASASSTWTWSTQSNLQRQILHNIDRIGDRKVDSAKKTLTALNPDVNVVTYDVRLDAEQHRCDILAGYDVVVDGADNFPTRYLLNDASREARHPGRARLDLPLRGHGHRLRPDERPDLPRHGARAAAGRAGAVLRRGRRARRAARHHRLDPGARGDQAAPRPRRPARSAGCSPSTRSSRASASSSSSATRPTRSPTRTATASRSPSSTGSAAPPAAAAGVAFQRYQPPLRRVRRPSASLPACVDERVQRQNPLPEGAPRRGGGPGRQRRWRSSCSCGVASRALAPPPTASLGGVLGADVRGGQRDHAAARAGGRPGRVGSPGRAASAPDRSSSGPRSSAAASRSSWPSSCCCSTRCSRSGSTTTACS